MVAALLDDIVMTDYRSFTIQWNLGDGFDGDPDTVFAGQENGLVGAASPLFLFMVLGRRSGGSSVRIELSATEPEDDATWEDCVEVSTRVPEGSRPFWAGWGGMSFGYLDIPPGPYRVRVLARGRQAGSDGEFEPEVVDFYCLQFWPAEERLDRIVRVGGPDAEYWHDAWGRRR